MVIFYKDDFVIINDLYPKASIHLLLLPRSSEYTKLPPMTAFRDLKFLENVKSEAAVWKQYVVEKLKTE